MRITGRGWGLLVAGALLLGGGFWFGYPELAALGVACVIAVAAALVFAAWRPRLVITRSADPDRVVRGESSELTVAISNASRLFGANLVARDRVTPGGSVAVPLVRLRPGKTANVRYPVPTRRRGLIAVGPLEVSRRDPLVLVSAVRRYGAAVQVWVRPRVHPIGNVPVGLSRSMDGRVDRVPQGSITFAALREYVVGDDLRQVHWRTSARVGSLMVREHMDTSLPRLVLLLDDRACAHGVGPDGESTFEAACEAAASVLVAATHDGVHVELRPLHGRPASAANQTEAGALLDLLAEATLAGATVAGATVARAAPASPGERPEQSLRAAVEGLRARRSGDTLLYLSGPPDEEDLALVAGLRGAYPSIIAGVFGSVESGLATSGGMLVVAAVDGPDFAGAWDGIRAW